MIRKSKKTILACSILAVVFFLCSTYFLLSSLPSLVPNQKVKNLSFEEYIDLELNNLSPFYRTLPKALDVQQNKILNYIQYVNRTNDLTSTNLEALWHLAQSWASKKQLFNVSDAAIGTVILAMKHAPIIQADLDVRGTQLKFLLKLEGGQQVIFKPKWYDRNEIIKGPVYAGKDRYGAEILAFYLSIILEKPLTPISVPRDISLKYEILPVATTRLLETSYRTRSNRSCVYGKCLYCKREDPICASDNAKLTGAVIFNVNKVLTLYRSPWQRTYKKGTIAVWEESSDYCKAIKNKLPYKRLLDLIDTAIFDFLIQNGDRHHYETLDDTVVLLDNGKGLGNPHINHLDILAPLYQCCMIRNQTWKQLLNLRGGTLQTLLRLIPNLEDVVSDLHLKAMDERLLIVFATVEYCKNKDLRFY